MRGCCEVELILFINCQEMLEMNPPRQFHSLAEVREYAQANNRDLLLLDDAVLDVTTFAEHHPGGGVLLRNQREREVSAQMKWHHPLTLVMANTMAIGSFKKEISRLIKPDRAFMPQIWELDHETYMKVVNSPHWLFVPSPRMFETDFLEVFTHCRWYMALIMPAILITYLFTQVSNWHQFDPSTACLAALTGLLFFTLVEYSLHRFIFHCEKHLPDSRLARYIHFMSHGIHHMLPNDPDRLVLPPPFFIVVITLGYFTVGWVVRFQDPLISAIFWTFFYLGYTAYDTCHYALHHIDTTKSKGSYFHQLQKYHNQHHFGGEEAGFGVSSKLWDVVFGTGFKKGKKQSKQ